ncbi:MAG: fluoride efflux transporter CrcB [Gemmobacter sp.]
MLGNLLMVAAGGAAGSVARYLVVMAGVRVYGPGFPVGTLAVNVLGCFLMGVLWVWLTQTGRLAASPLLTAGLLGGFTTFSTFALDALGLWERGAVAAAAAYVVASVLLSLLAVLGGVLLMRGALA